MIPKRADAVQQQRDQQSVDRQTRIDEARKNAKESVEGKVEEKLDERKDKRSERQHVRHEADATTTTDEHVRR